jgi:hypothetical protein
MSPPIMKFVTRHTVEPVTEFMINGGGERLH